MKNNEKSLFSGNAGSILGLEKGQILCKKLGQLVKIIGKCKA